MKSTVTTIALFLSCYLIQSCGTGKLTFTVETEQYETDSYIAEMVYFIGTAYREHNAWIMSISLKDNILQSKEIILPETVVYKGINYSITEIINWEERLVVPKRSNTSENLELAVEKILLPNTMEKIQFTGFERFKNLRMINTPSSLNKKWISVKSGKFNDECSSAYRDNVVKQWKYRQTGSYLSTFDNYSYNTYKWSLDAFTGAGVAEHSDTNIVTVTNDNQRNRDNTDPMVRFFYPDGNTNVSTSSLSKGNTFVNKVEIPQLVYSDVDTNIPTNSQSNDGIFAVIISNENYRRESKVEYALSDGKIFKEYCLKTLGIPQSNVHHVNDATLNDIRAEIRWIQKVASAYNGEAKFIFYYAGHGIPDERSNSAYLLPIDGFGGDVTTGYKISDLYAILSQCPAEYVLVFLDACFSGAERSGKMLASSRGIALKTKTEVPAGNMIVFSAATADETAFPYKEQRHGLFTYFLLRKLQESNGVVSFGELGDYIITNVSRRSIVDNLKPQTPTIIPAPNLTKKWRDMHF